MKAGAAFKVKTVFMLTMASLSVQTGRSSGEFSSLHSQLSAPTAHLPQTGCQKGTADFYSFRSQFILSLCSRDGYLLLYRCYVTVSEDHHGSGPLGHVLWEPGLHRSDRAPPDRAGEERQHVDYQNIHPVHGRHQQTGRTQDR